MRWAHQQATAPQAATTGIADLAALMQAASASGVVTEHSDEREPVTLLPDTELLNLCREATGCDRIADEERNGKARFERLEVKTAMSRLHEACRTKAQIMPQIIELDATTPAGVIAKAEVIGRLFNGTGQRSDAVRSLVANVVAGFGAVEAPAEGEHEQ